MARKTLAKKTKVLNLLSKGAPVSWATLRNKFDWSRSRQKLWKKGESSGNLQEVKEIRVDCDADCVVIKVNQIGGSACHTGYRSCFYRVIKGDELVTEGQPVFDPDEVYGKDKKNG